MDMEYINGQIQVYTKEIGNKIKYRVMESTPGMMVERTKGTGLIIICMAKEYTVGQMVANTRENT